ncbi:IGL1 protein, partial [Upupa epops]|nr:IGL1 protein [Upupa epops]
LHWYRQLPGEPPKRIVYMLGQNPVFDDGVDGARFEAWRDPNQPRYGLTIHYLTPQDSGTYYCAYWHHSPLSTVIGYSKKVFGSGTKLIVSDQGVSPPADFEIMQAEHENKITYICLIDKFYPEVIRVTWTEEGKEIKDNIVKGDTWKPVAGDKYSIGSWLTVPAENKNKNYHCKYDHESQSRSLATKDIADSTMREDEEDCPTYSVLNRDQLMHRTAYLVYLVLLLKSSVYYLI